MAFQIAKGPVFMCSGQGSQKPGMGVDLLEVPEVAGVFACASEVFERDVAALCQAPAEELNKTENAQAALCALSVGVAEAAMTRGVQPAAVLGFSLGQISALAVSGMLSVKATFELLKVRASCMARAAEEHPGVMGAFLKGTAEEVEQVCVQCAQGEVLVPANYNSPAQTVVSGTEAALSRAEAEWKERGGRVRRLATAGAFHSPCMQSAADEFAEYLATVDFAEPQVPLICNTDARPLAACDAAAHLSAHLTHGVKFEQSVRVLAEAGAGEFVEVGFGGVLSGLVKRIDGELAHRNVQDVASLEQLVTDFA